jgi:hypothetical protein
MMMEWIIRNRLTILPIAVAVDVAAWAAVIFFGWHYFSCG